MDNEIALNIRNYLKKIFMLLIFFLGLNQIIFAQANFLIWPIYPVIESSEKATPVWLENTGKDSAMVQIRVFKWSQSNGEDEYENQQEIIASPPIVKIEGEVKQMIRLSRSSVSLADEKEHTYRIIIDELPFNSEQNKEISQVSLKMRYSLPFFVYGKGLGSGKSEQTVKINEKNPRAKSILNWSIHSQDNKNYLQIENTGLLTARISGFKINDQNFKSLTESSSFGYVLPGKAYNFELSSDIKQLLDRQKELYAVVGKDISPILITKK